MSDEEINQEINNCSIKIHNRYKINEEIAVFLKKQGGQITHKQYRQLVLNFTFYNSSAGDCQKQIECVEKIIWPLVSDELSEVMGET